MKSRGLRLVSIPRWASIAVGLVVLTPNTVFATDFELPQLVNQIELISAQLADDLRYTRHYDSVRQRAVTLRMKASRLANSLRRYRSNSHIRSHFKDVRRGYERLEQAFFAADRRSHDSNLYREISLLSNVFTNLSDEFYYACLRKQSYDPAYNSLYSAISIISLRNYGFRNYGSLNSGSPHSGSRDIDPRRGNSAYYDRRDHESRSNGRIKPNRQRAVPPVFRGNNGGAAPSRQEGGGDQSRGQGQRTERGGRDRSAEAVPDRGSRSVQSAPSSDHRSNVLERQGRQNAERRELENQGRKNRSAVSPRQSSRGANVQRRRGGRNGIPESRRRN